MDLDKRENSAERGTNQEEFVRWPFLAHAGLVVLAFLVLALIFYAPVVLGMRSFPDGDFTHHFLPFSLFQQRALLAGQLPLWNPFTYGGHPFLADIQAAIFYPISNAILLPTAPFTAPGARLYFLQLEAIIQIALAGFFTFLLVRDLTGSRWPAFIGGLLFAFSGYLTGYPPVQLAVLRTAIWLPLILWSLWRAYDRPTVWRWWLGAGTAYAVAFLAGHPQTFLHISYTLVAWMLFLLIAGLRANGAHRRRRAVQQAVGSAGVFVLAAGLSAAQLLPTLEFTGLSVRADVDYAYVSGGFPLQDTWQLLMPGLFTNYSPIYIGAVGLGLAATGIALLFDGEALTDLSATLRYRPASPRGVLLFFGTLTLIALLLSYGRNGFLYSFFYWLAPGWRLFRGQERVAYLVTLGLVVVAGYGAAAIPRLSLRHRHRLALIYGALVVAGVYIVGLMWQLNGRTAIGQWAYLGIALITLLLGVGYALMIWLDGWSARRASILTILVVANLFWANFGTNLAPFNPVRKTILAPEMVALGTAATASVPTGGELSGRVYNEFRIYEDYGMRQEIDDVWGSSPLRLATYASLFENFPLDRMWDLMGVDLVLTWRSDLFEAADLLAEFPQQIDTTYLHKLTEPNPRAWVATEVEIVDDESALALLADHTFDLRRTALVAADGPSTIPVEPPWLDASQTEAATEIGLTRTKPGHLHVRVDRANGPILVISENWMPGWQSDPPLPILRTDLSLLGVLLPDSSTEFDLYYQPQSVRIGLLISGTTLLLLLLIIGFRLRDQQRAAGRS